jgi:hypothetical protein
MAIQIGSQAPDFELMSSELGDDGKPSKKITLSAYRGKKNVVSRLLPARL